jgi:membrane-associated phospholipid phosphatase
MMGFTILTYGGGLLMFVLYPTCQNLRPEVFLRDNVLTRTMAWFYTTDTSTNVCPSLHVCGSLAAAFGLVDTKRFSAPGRRAIMAVAMTICLSTVFVKQHSILDMLWGFGFSGCAWLAVYGEKTSEFFRFPFLASRSLP